MIIPTKEEYSEMSLRQLQVWAMKNGLPLANLNTNALRHRLGRQGHLVVGYRNLRLDGYLDHIDVVFRGIYDLKAVRLVAIKQTDEWPFDFVGIFTFHSGPEPARYNWLISYTNDIQPSVGFGKVIGGLTHHLPEGSRLILHTTIGKNRMKKLLIHPEERTIKQVFRVRISDEMALPPIIYFLDTMKEGMMANLRDMNFHSVDLGTYMTDVQKTFLVFQFASADFDERFWVTDEGANLLADLGKIEGIMSLTPEPDFDFSNFIVVK